MQERTESDKRDIVKKIDAQRRKGIKVEDAAKSLGVTYHDYYNWRPKPKAAQGSKPQKPATKAAPKHAVLDIPSLPLPSRKVVLLMVDPQDLPAIVRSLQ
jgi:hypothetical protein